MKLSPSLLLPVALLLAGCSSSVPDVTLGASPEPTPTPAATTQAPPERIKSPRQDEMKKEAGRAWEAVKEVVADGDQVTVHLHQPRSYAMTDVNALGLCQAADDVFAPAKIVVLSSDNQVVGGKGGWVARCADFKAA